MSITLAEHMAKARAAIKNPAASARANGRKGGRPKGAKDSYKRERLSGKPQPSASAGTVNARREK